MNPEIPETHSQKEPENPHQPIRRILVPVDFSEEGKCAITYAANFAAISGVNLYLLHVMDPAQYMVGYEGLYFDMAAEREKIMKDLRNVRTDFPPQVNCEFAIREGVPFHEIVTAADELESNLIIMSTHGRTGLMHVLIGSTAERVVRHAGCPVLIVPSRMKVH